MTKHIAPSDALHLHSLSGPVVTSSPRATPFRLVRRAAPLLSSVLLGLTLAGCGGADSSTATPGAAAVSSKALKADGDITAGAQGEGTSQASTTSAQQNTIATIVSDMSERNDFVLRGYEGEANGWYVGPGSTVMGNDPRLRTAEFWSSSWDGGNYSGATATAMLPWVAVFDGVDHRASNTAIELRNMRVYLKSKSTGAWTLLGGPSKVTGTNFPRPGSGRGFEPDNFVQVSDTVTSIRVGHDGGIFWHGWWDAGVKQVNPGDIDAFFVTVQARLGVADGAGPDDRQSAQLGLQVGADYYLETSSSYDYQVAPNIGISRTKKLTNEWQAFNYTTFSDVGSQSPGGGITEASFRANPPPLE